MDKEQRVCYARTLVEAANTRNRHRNRVVVLIASLMLCLTLAFSLTSCTGKEADRQGNNISGSTVSGSQNTPDENNEADGQDTSDGNSGEDDRNTPDGNNGAGDQNTSDGNSGTDNQNAPDGNNNADDQKTGKEQNVNNADGIQNTNNNSKLDSSSIEAQLRLITENRSMWRIADITNLWNYAVTDLDANGRLELVSIEMSSGSGLYSSNYFWEVNESFDKLVLCQQNITEEESQADIYYNDCAPVYYDSKQDAYLYIFGDSEKEGPGTRYEDNIRTISLKDGQIRDNILARKISTNGNGASVSCEDAEGNTISEAAYEKIVDTYLGEMNSGVVFFGWVKPNLRSGTESTDEELLQLLTDSYGEFSIKLNEGSSLPAFSKILARIRQDAKEHSMELTAIEANQDVVVAVLTKRNGYRNEGILYQGSGNLVVVAYDTGTCEWLMSPIKKFACYQHEYLLQKTEGEIYLALNLANQFSTMSFYNLSVYRFTKDGYEKAAFGETTSIDYWRKRKAVLQQDGTIVVSNRNLEDSIYSQMIMEGEVYRFNPLMIPPIEWKTEDTLDIKNLNYRKPEFADLSEGDILADVFDFYYMDPVMNTNYYNGIVALTEEQPDGSLLVITKLIGLESLSITGAQDIMILLYNPNGSLAQRKFVYGDKAVISRKATEGEEKIHISVEVENEDSRSGLAGFVSARDGKILISAGGGK